MKRLLITAALAISMITLLAACGGESTEAEPSNPETTSGSTGIEPEDTGTSDSIIDPDAHVQMYLSLMDDLANALRSSNTEDLSADSLDEIKEITSRLETFSGFFNGLDEAGRNYLFGKYGVELRQTAERVANYAITTQERRGDEAIAQELARLPAFAITTTNIGTGSSPEPVLVPAGDISTLLTVNDVSGLADGVGLSTRQEDMKSRAASVDPSQVEHMVSFDALSFDTADGSKELQLTTIQFDSEGGATDHWALVTSEESGMEDFTDTIGDASGFIEANTAGIGSMVIFKKGTWVVMLHTTQRDGVAPLVDVAGVEALARMVADRL